MLKLLSLIGCVVLPIAAFILEASVNNQILGFAFVVIVALVGLSYRGLVKDIAEIKEDGAATRLSVALVRDHVSRLTDGVFLLEAQLHPDNAEMIIRALRQVQEGNK